MAVQLVPIVIYVGGRAVVRMVSQSIAHKYIKDGIAKKLTKNLWTKGMEIFKHNKSGKFKKVTQTEKNKILESVNIKPTKITPKKIKIKQEPNPWKGIRKNETIEQFLARKAKDSKTILPKETKKIIENIKKARAKDKTIVKATETEKAKTLIQAAKADKLPAPISQVKETLAKGTKVEAPVVKGGGVWETAKKAMKVAGYVFGGLTAGGILFYHLRDKDKDPDQKVVVDLPNEVTTAVDKTKTQVIPETVIPSKEMVHAPTFESTDPLVKKLQNLDEKDFEIITPDNTVIKDIKIPIPGFSNVVTDTGK